MGGFNWDHSDWAKTAATNNARPAAQVFQQHGMHADLNPLGVKLRESRDSAVHPESHAIIVGSDVTGSMNILAEALVRKGMGTLVEELLDRKPVASPHIMCMGIGDAISDRAPLQATQFEADIRIVQQLQQIWLEGNGGGNGGESYHLAWYFAARHTSIDCFEKRGKKGYLFTIGDENPHKVLTRAQIKRIFGDDVESDLTSEDLLAMVSQTYHVYHLLVEESHSCYPGVIKNWKGLLGERALPLADHTKMAELIVSTIAVNEGASVDAVVKSWSGDTSLVVSRGLGGLRPAAQGTGVVRF